MNLGSGIDIRIDDLTRMVMDVMRLQGDLREGTKAVYKNAHFR